MELYVLENIDNCQSEASFWPACTQPLWYFLGFEPKICHCFWLWIETSWGWGWNWMGYIRILSIGLELACNGGSRGEPVWRNIIKNRLMPFVFEKTPCSLNCKLVPVQYRGHECRLLHLALRWTNIPFPSCYGNRDKLRPERATWLVGSFTYLPIAPLVLRCGPLCPFLKTVTEYH